MRISDWSSDVCSSDLDDGRPPGSGEDRLGRGPWPASHHPFVHRVEPERHGGRAVHDDVHPEDGDGRERLATGDAEDRRGQEDRGEAQRGAQLEADELRSEEHTSELQSLMRYSYA